MDNGASSYRRFLDGDDNGLVEIIRSYNDGLTLYLNMLSAGLRLPYLPETVAEVAAQFRRQLFSE